MRSDTTQLIKLISVIINVVIFDMIKNIIVRMNLINLVLHWMKMGMNQNMNGSTPVHKTRNEGTSKCLVFVQSEHVVVFSTLALRLQGDSTICKHTSRQGAMCLLEHQKSS
jgi:hypothetical protein